MQFARYGRGERPRWGVLDGDEVHALAADPQGEPDLETVSNPSYRRRIRALVEDGVLPTIDRADVRLHAPVPRPGKIVCVGLNYHDHAEEQDQEIPEKPLLFGKAPESVIDPGAPIVHPPDVEQVDYEVELGVVMGKTAYKVGATGAEPYVAGYTVVNDVSARDAQFEDGQWFRGKSYDTFAPMGPVLATGEDFDPNDTLVSLLVNGETKQSSTTGEFIFDVGELIEYVSHVTTLHPGDVISTGTPGGVGIFRDPPELLAPGDVVEASVEGIGTITNPVVEGR